jgi:hypothetical protein
MVNVVNQFMSVVAGGNSSERDKGYWENVKKAATSLEKASVGDLDKLFEAIYARKPVEVGALVFVLGARIKKPTSDHDSGIHLLKQTDYVAREVTSEDLDHIHDKFCSVMYQLTNFLIENHLAIHGLQILQNAVRSLSRGHRAVITNLHSRLFLLCLTSKRFDPAFDYLNLDASECFLNSQQLHRVTCENALLFFYYGGIIKMALKDFHGAAFLFESCVCMPAISASTIMLEALKKLILLNAILGRSHILPGYRSQPIQRIVQSKCQKYQGVSQVFNEVTENKNKSPNATLGRLGDMVGKNQGEWNKDKNGGLVQELLWSAIRKNISKLPGVFSKLELNKIGKYCRLADESIDLQHFLENFLQCDDVDGKIDLRDQTVSFNPVQSSVEIDHDKLDNATNVCAALDNLMRNSHRVVDMHPTILARHFKKQNGQGLPSAVNFT